MSNAGRVLVVEDHAFVRAAAADALEDEGYDVLEAPSADYTATLLEAREDIGMCRKRFVSEFQLLRLWSQW